MTGVLHGSMQYKNKEEIIWNWGTPFCEIKTIYIKEYFKVDGAIYTDDLRLKNNPKRGSLQAERSI